LKKVVETWQVLGSLKKKKFQALKTGSGNLGSKGKSVPGERGGVRNYKEKPRRPVSHKHVDG
jgi:hypothetical protein